MVKTAYREAPNFKPGTRAMLGKIIAIVERYRQAGYRMTLRQLFYQLVVASVFANRQQNYAKLSDLLGTARMSGLVDWDFIEDRLRVPRLPNEFDDIADGLDTLVKAYRLDRWHGQAEYVEVWVEKDALSGVLNPITAEYHVRLMVNRGYSSITAMHDASLRFRRASLDGKECSVLYFGDHDPSGEDMVRDIADRLAGLASVVDVPKIALTMDQVREHSLPPNPAKMTDSRAPGYVAQHGDESWELDALPPDVLDRLVRGAIDEHLDRGLFDQVVAEEETHKEYLKKLIKSDESTDLDRAWHAWQVYHPTGGDDTPDSVER